MHRDAVPLNRRQFLAGAAATGLLPLAGCLDGGVSNPTAWFNIQPDTKTRFAVQKSMKTLALDAVKGRISDAASAGTEIDYRDIGGLRWNPPLTPAEKSQLREMVSEHAAEEREDETYQYLLGQASQPLFSREELNDEFITGIVTPSTVDMEAETHLKRGNPVKFTMDIPIPQRAFQVAKEYSVQVSAPDGFVYSFSWDSPYAPPTSWYSVSKRAVSIGGETMVFDRPTMAETGSMSGFSHTAHPFLSIVQSSALQRALILEYVWNSITGKPNNVAETKEKTLEVSRSQILAGLDEADVRAYLVWSAVEVGLIAGGGLVGGPVGAAVGAGMAEVMELAFTLKATLSGIETAEFSPIDPVEGVAMAKQAPDVFYTPDTTDKDLSCDCGTLGDIATLARFQAHAATAASAINPTADAIRSDYRDLLDEQIPALEEMGAQIEEAIRAGDTKKKMQMADTVDKMSTVAKHEKLIMEAYWATLDV